jgi:hypothetical protein
MQGRSVHAVAPDGFSGITIDALNQTADDAELASVHDTYMQNMSAPDCFFLFSSTVPALREFESSWRLTGAQLLQLQPTLFAQNLQRELPSLSETVCADLLRAVQAKIVHDHDAMLSAGISAVPSELSVLWASSEAPRMQPQSAVEMNLSLVHKIRTVLNPLDGMFHVFISYRVATDSKLSLDLHDRLLVLSTSEDFKIPLLSRTKRPKQFKASLHAKGMTVFLDARCLSDGDEWRGDGAMQTGFVAGLLKSAMFVPMISWIPDATDGYTGSVGGLVHVAQPACDVAVEVKSPGACIHLLSCNRTLKIGSQVSFTGPDLNILQIAAHAQYFVVASINSTISVSLDREGTPIEFNTSCRNFSLSIPASDDQVDNVLLELLLAQELHLAGKGQSGSIVTCGVILPVFIGDFPLLNLLSTHASKATNSLACSILSASKLVVSPQCLSRSVRDIVSFFLDFQGIRLSDYCSTYPLTVCSDHGLNTVSERIIKRVSKYMEQGSVSLFESSRPLSQETSAWLYQRGMGIYGPILAVHNISSLRQLCAIDVFSINISPLIADAAAVSGRSVVEEALRLQATVQDARSDPLSRTLSARLFLYVDVNASFLTAISSLAALEIALSKPQIKLFSFLCMVHNLFSIFLFAHGVEGYELATASPLWLLSFLSAVLSVSLVCSLLLSPPLCRWICFCLFLSGVIAATAQFFGPDRGHTVCNYVSFHGPICLFYQKISFAFFICWCCLFMFSISKRQDLFWYSVFAPLFVYFLIFIIISWSASERFHLENYWGSIEMCVLVFGLCLVPCLLRRVALNAAEAFTREDTREFEAIYSDVLQRDQCAIQDLDSLINTHFACVQDTSLYGGRSLHPRQAHADIDRLYSDAESMNSAFQELCSSWFNEDPHAWIPLCDASLSAQAAFDFKGYTSFSSEIPIVICGPVKLANRSICKIVRLYKGDVSRLTDLVRCTIVFPTMSELVQFMRVLSERGHVRPSHSRRTFMDNMVRFHQYFNNRVLGLPSRQLPCKEEISDRHAFEILRIKNRFKPSNPGDARRVVGYRDVSIKVKIGYKESPNGSIIFAPVKEWSENRVIVRTIVAEIQLRLRDFQNVLEQKTSIHDNYVFYRDILSS